jgi:hypothetical protein
MADVQIAVGLGRKASQDAGVTGSHVVGDDLAKKMSGFFRGQRFHVLRNLGNVAATYAMRSIAIPY